MKDIDLILHSEYIIDGQRMDATPAQMLSECMPAAGQGLSQRDYPPIVDEPSDPVPEQVRAVNNVIPENQDSPCRQNRLNCSSASSSFPS